jgi:asparagine N-glycosylation enzyme membrane subunit Stt3
MEAIRQTQKKYCTRAMVTAIAIGGFLILIGQPPVGKGIILGTIFSVINFILIGETLPLRLGKTSGKTFLIAFGSIFFRFGLMAVPLVLAIKFDQFNIFTVIIGIFAVQMVILADNLFGMIGSTRG